MTAKFEIFLDRKKQYQFHLKVSNEETIVASQAYDTKAACIKGIKSIQKSAASSAETKEKKPRSPKPKAE
jgi:uncharacterized protein YegP (UPF0339 family)